MTKGIGSSIGGYTIGSLLGRDPIPVGMRAESRRESAEVEIEDFLVTRAG
jgi:hypothetical protein